jgi:hypothetical protein
MSPKIILITIFICILSLVQLLPINYEDFGEPEVEHNLDDR